MSLPSSVSLGALLSSLILPTSPVPSLSPSSSSSSSTTSPLISPSLPSSVSISIASVVTSNSSHKICQLSSRRSSPTSSYPRKRTAGRTAATKSSMADLSKRLSRLSAAAAVTKTNTTKITTPTTAPRFLTPPSSPPKMMQNKGHSGATEFDAWLQRARNTRGSNAGLPTAGTVALPLSPLFPGTESDTSDSIRQRYEHALDDMARSAMSPSSLARIGHNKESRSHTQCLSDMSLAERHLRRLALVHPIPAGHDDLRRRLWRALLSREGNFTQLRCIYPELKTRGASVLHLQIQHDLATLKHSNRLLSSSIQAKEQHRIVESLDRILNAFVHQIHDTADNGTKDYVSGLHWIALSFAEVLPEDEAFVGFYLFATKCASVYARTTMDGIQCAVELMDECLRVLDRPLYDYLLDHGVFPELYAYNALLSFTSCSKSMNQQDHLRLWDVFLAYGIHINVLCVVAQLIHSRDLLLAADQPLSILSDGLDGDIHQTINDALSLSRQLPPELYRALALHANDASVRDLLPLVP
ncbi:rab-GTPase-TBC domain-containing protein [Syncephalis fuscata]|nr:rab-GTPase-TBC domain-containing protein [Syncephalis fuscata]